MLNDNKKVDVQFQAWYENEDVEGSKLTKSSCCGHQV